MNEFRTGKRYIKSICKLTLEEKIEIVHQYLLGLQTQRDVAQAMGGKITVVKSLMKKVKANVDYLQELRAKENDKQNVIAVVESETQALLRQKKIIKKASMVKHIIKENHGLLLKDQTICKIFHEYLGMKYKKVKRIAFKGNAEKNLVLR